MIEHTGGDFSSGWPIGFKMAILNTLAIIDETYPKKLELRPWSLLRVVYHWKLLLDFKADRKQFDEKDVIEAESG